METRARDPWALAEGQPHIYVKIRLAGTGRLQVLPLLAGLRVVPEDLQNWALLQLYSLVCNLVDSTDCCLLS